MQDPVIPINGGLDPLFEQRLTAIEVRYLTLLKDVTSCFADIRAIRDTVTRTQKGVEQLHALVTDLQVKSSKTVLVRSRKRSK